MVVKKFLMILTILAFLPPAFSACRVTVRVIDENSNPIENAMITFDGLHYYTNVNGIASFNFPYNSGIIRVEKEGFESVERSIECPPCSNPITITITMKKVKQQVFGCPVFLQFIDECSKCGIKDVKVFLNGEEVGKTDENGIISFFVNYGNVQIYAEKDGFHPFLANYVCVNGIIIDETIELKRVTKCVKNEEIFVSNNDSVLKEKKYIDFELSLDIEDTTLKKGEKTLIKGKIKVKGNDFPYSALIELLLDNKILAQKEVIFERENETVEISYVLSSNDLNVGEYYVTLKLENKIEKSVSQRISVYQPKIPETKKTEKKKIHCLTFYELKNYNVEKGKVNQIMFWLENCGDFDESELEVELIYLNKKVAKKIPMIKKSEIIPITLSLFIPEDFEKSVAYLRIRNENVSINANFLIKPLSEKVFIYFPLEIKKECGVQEFEIKLVNYGEVKIEDELEIFTNYQHEKIPVKLKPGEEKYLTIFLDVPCKENEILVKANFHGEERTGKIIVMKGFELNLYTIYFLLALTLSIPLILISLTIIKQKRLPCLPHPKELKV